MEIENGFSIAALAALMAGDVSNFMVASMPGGIEAQEAAGQRSFVASQTLPRNLRDGREAWERLGFVFGEDADDLFINCSFPEGWTKRATDHSMWSDVVDSEGVKRGAVFYKAAFYDRSAYAYLENIFTPAASE